jgi:hypothetical protein
MTAPRPQVVPIFATPFGVVSVRDAESLNPRVAALFAERRTPERAEPTNRQAFTFRSRDDLFDWSEEPVRKLAGGIIEAVVAVVRSFNDYSDEQFAAFKLQARAWFTVVQPDGCVPSTNYPNAAWCALYCVDAPQVAKDRFDSGVLRLHESFRATMFSDATNTLTHMPYRPGHNTWRPVPGQLAVFPAAITHEIALLRGSGSLVLVTALMRFVAPEQSGMPWW